jgi:hypothetical protein
VLKKHSFFAESLQRSICVTSDNSWLFSALPGWVSVLSDAIDSRQKEDFENGKT